MNKLKASDKLNLLVFVMSIFIVGIGIYGISEMKTMNQKTHTLYADRVIPMGIDVENVKEGIGLANMNRRVRLFSGNFTIESSVGTGCEIILEIPLLNAS